MDKVSSRHRQTSRHFSRPVLRCSDLTAGWRSTSLRTGSGNANLRTSFPTSIDGYCKSSSSMSVAVAPPRYGARAQSLRSAESRVETQNYHLSCTPGNPRFVGRRASARTKLLAFEQPLLLRPASFTAPAKWRFAFAANCAMHVPKNTCFWGGDLRPVRTCKMNELRIRLIEGFRNAFKATKRYSVAQRL